MVMEASIRGIPQEVLNSIPEVFGSAPVATGGFQEEPEEVPAVIPFVTSREPKPAEEVINKGLRLL